MKTKYAVIGFFALLLILCGLFFMPAMSGSGNKSKGPDVLANAEVITPKDVNKESVVVHPVASGSGNNFPTPKEWGEHQKFHDYDVVLGGDNKSGYSAYTEAQLVELAEKGDIMAMKILAKRYNIAANEKHRSLAGVLYVEVKNKLRNEFEILYGKEKFYIDKAILYGDREYLTDMPNGRASLDLSDSNPEIVKAALFETMAVSEFWGMRGMLDQKYESLSSLLNIYHKTQGEKAIKFTPEIYQQIKARAAEIYNNYEERRIALGLGPFDNSLPQGKEKEVQWWSAELKKRTEAELGYELP